MEWNRSGNGMEKEWKICFQIDWKETYMEWNGNFTTKKIVAKWNGNGIEMEWK